MWFTFLTERNHLIAPGSIPRSLLRTFNFEIWKLKCLGACPEDLYCQESPFRIHLTADEQLALQHIAQKYTLPYFQVTRAKIILFAAEGVANKDIAEYLRVPREIVSKWRKRFFEHRLTGL